MRPNDKAEVEHSGLKHICYGLLILVLVFGLTGSAIAQGTTTQITNNANNDELSSDTQRHHHMEGI